MGSSSTPPAITDKTAEAERGQQVVELIRMLQHQLAAANSTMGMLMRTIAPREGEGPKRRTFGQGDSAHAAEELVRRVKRSKS